MTQNAALTDAERIARLEAEVAELRAERAEFRSEIARIEAELEKHIIKCPGSSAIDRQRAMKKKASQEDRAAREA